MLPKQLANAFFTSEKHKLIKSLDFNHLLSQIIGILSVNQIWLTTSLFVYVLQTPLVHPAKTQFSMGIRPVWSESSLCAPWVAKDHNFLQANSEDSDQTGQMPRLIWVFAGHTYHFVGFVTMRLTLRSCEKERQAFTYILDNICIRYGTILYRQVVCIPMGITNCAPLVFFSLCFLFAIKEISWSLFPGIRTLKLL